MITKPPVLLDGYVLQQAMSEVAMEVMRKEIHEWITMTAPVNVQHVYQRYIELLEKQEIKIDD